MAETRICTQCHAPLPPSGVAQVCPACGGKLAVWNSFDPADTAGAPQREIDHRGILLPARHAVGGIITPR